MATVKLFVRVSLTQSIKYVLFAWQDVLPSADQNQMEVEDLGAQN
jgi:hypothetical protein